jgi:Rieske Fe-S protein
MTDSNRRQFLKRSAVTTAGLTSLVVLPCAGCATADPAATEPAASRGAVDAGALDGLVAGPAVNGAFVRRGHFVLVRQQQRLYALSSVCTHRACDVKPATAKHASPELYCPCHGAEFDLGGQVTHGPAKRPLKRLAISLNVERHLIVDASRQFDLDQRDDPQAYVSLANPS